MTQDWSFGAGQAAPVPVKGRGLTITGAVLLVVSVIVGVVGLVGVVRSASALVQGFGQSFFTPGSVVRTLEAGSSTTVYQLDAPGQPPVPASDITVTGPGGFAVPITPLAYDSSITSDSETFLAIAEFEVPTTGDYRIEVATEGATMIVAPGLESLASTGLWVLVIGIAVLLFVIGLVLLIVGLVQRSSSRKAAGRAGPAYGAGAYGAPSSYPVQQAPQPSVVPDAAGPVPPAAPPASVLPPAGWYPDPARPGGQRYWDGGTWTEHIA